MTARRFAIAVDAGGSTTRAVLLDRQGTCLAEAHAGPGNLRAVGADEATANITSACLLVAQQSDDWPDLFVVSAAGILSVGGEFPELHREFSREGLEGPLRLEPDLLGAYFSATSEPNGSVVIAGTGTNAARIVDGEVLLIRDGLGWLLGDGGGGFWLGHQVARAAARHLEGRGPETSLTDSVVAMAGRSHHLTPGRDPRLAGLIDWAYGRTPVQLARLAPIAMQAAREGDAVAIRICRKAAKRILDTVASLPDRGNGPIALGGGILSAQSPIADRVTAELGQQAILVRDGVVGAAYMAVAMMGGRNDEAMRLHIQDSLSRLRG